MNGTYIPIVTAAIGFVGGIVVAIIGTLVKAWLDGRAERQRWRREDRFRYQAERSQAYAAFLKAAEAVERYHFSGLTGMTDPQDPYNPLGSVERVDAMLRTLDDLAAAYQSVCIFGTQVAVEAATAYRDGIVTPEGPTPPPESPPDVYQGILSTYTTSAKSLRRAFLDTVRDELGVPHA